MEFQKLCLLEFECNREGVGNFYGLAVVTSGYPGGHRGNHAYGFAVESGMTGANNANVCDATVFTYHEFNNYATLGTFFGCGRGINDVVAEPGVHCGFATGEAWLLFHQCYAEWFVIDYGFSDNLLFDLDFVKVVHTFGDVDGAELGFVLADVFLVLDLLVLFDFLDRKSVV